jgi:N-carbamoyl-L-amino-acid hydrolase
MLLELRDIKSEVMDRLEARIHALVAQASSGAVPIDVEATARIPPTVLAEDLGAAIAAAAAAHGETPVHLPSGAGHDAMVVARFMPAAMMFIPSIDGISHDVRENTSDADIIFGCEVLADAVARLRRQ